MPQTLRLQNYEAPLKIAGVGIVLLIALIVRSFNLELLPPFIDEGGHLNMAIHYDYFSIYQRASQGGKLLGFFLFYPIARWADTPLYVARLSIALIGVITTLGIFWATQRLAGYLAAYIAAMIWALLPYAVFHDRLALHDPLISFFMVWAIVFLIEARLKNYKPWAFLSGFLLGLAVATKATALIGLVWLLFLSLVPLKPRQTAASRAIILALLGGVALPLLAILLIILARLNDFLRYIDHFVSSSTQSIDRFSLFITNLNQLKEWFSDYNSSFFTIYAILVLCLGLLYPSKSKLALLLSFMVMVTPYMLFFEVWFPRYLLPALIPLVILMGMVTAEWISGAILSWSRAERVSFKVGYSFIALSLLLLLIIASFTWAKTHLMLQRQPLQVNIPAIDRDQYFNGWPSGTGLAEVSTFLLQYSSNSAAKVLVLTAGFGRHGFWTLPLLIPEDANLEFKVADFSSSEILPQILTEAAHRPTLILLEPPNHYIPAEVIESIDPFPNLIFEYKRPKAEGGFQIFQIDPQTQLKVQAN